MKNYCKISSRIIILNSLKNRACSIIFEHTVRSNGGAVISCFFLRIIIEMVLSQKHCFRPCLVFLRNVHTAVDINYYKTLGLNPSASKAEIKAAYYELSKKHHPDRNHGSQESARIFRNVKEAYEVLGNDQKRIQYDKDRIFKAIRRPPKVYYPDNSPDYKDEAEKIHFHSKTRPYFKQYSVGKTTYYDFDAWYEGHYGKQATREFTFRDSKQFRHAHRNVTEQETKSYEKVKSAFLFILYVMIFLTSISVFTSAKKRTI